MKELLRNLLLRLEPAELYQETSEIKIAAIKMSSMKDEFGDPVKASYEKPFMVDKRDLMFEMPFRMQIRYTAV
jgi:hypothetical protein